jgi:hypothetical protein
MFRNSLPALWVALGIEKPEDGINLREELNGEVRTYLVSAVKGKQCRR